MALTIILILLLLWLLWPWIWRLISPAVHRFWAHRTEDMMRRMMGMPSRKEEKRRRKKEGERSGFRGSSGSGRHHSAPRQSAAMLLQSVAVDVEYVEIKEYSARVTVENSGSGSRIKYEEQVSDVEYTEYRIKQA